MNSPTSASTRRSTIPSLCSYCCIAAYIGSVRQYCRRPSARRVPPRRFHRSTSANTKCSREAATHGALWPPSLAAPPSFPPSGISEKELPEKQTRWSPGFSPIAYLVLPQWSTPGSPASTSIPIDGWCATSHTRLGAQQFVTEQSSVQSSLVVDTLADMRNDDILMEAGVPAVDPRGS